ncbi:MAG: hypothetical protein DRJ50_02545, partial [Actinobacteria bacterium]
TSGWAALLGVLVVLAAAAALVLSFTANGVNTVSFAADYIVVCVLILAFGSLVVIGYHGLLRGVSLGSPHAPDAGAVVN